MTYCIRNGQRHCTIEGPSGAKARVYYNGFWGLQIIPANSPAAKIIPFKRRA